ncbi:hypothetical protein VTJ04DRAFT_7858 [Mycothermus thermophilus]|uniref:uncharacterized protein n=1 Tax=Humicola insolens TaxID=85995 RepID=UPI003742B97D
MDRHPPWSGQGQWQSGSQQFHQGHQQFHQSHRHFQQGYQPWQNGYQQWQNGYPQFQQGYLPQNGYQQSQQGYQQSWQGHPQYQNGYQPPMTGDFAQYAQHPAPFDPQRQQASVQVPSFHPPASRSAARPVNGPFSVTQPLERGGFREHKVERRKKINEKKLAKQWQLRQQQEEKVTEELLALIQKKEREQEREQEKKEQLLTLADETKPENEEHESEPSGFYHDTQTFYNAMLPLSDSKQPAPEPSRPYAAPSEKSGGVPEPTEAYLSQSSRDPVTLPNPKPILVVLDLNGALIHRGSSKRPTKFVFRPYAREFLAKLFANPNVRVAVWTSIQRQNIPAIVEKVFTPQQRQALVCVWDRKNFGLTRQDYHSRVQVYKRLTMLWEDPAVAGSHPRAAEGVKWSQKDTVLIDDSREKARSEPHNAVIVPEFVGDMKEKPAVLKQVENYLAELVKQEDVSAYIRHSPFKM